MFIKQKCLIYYYNMHLDLDLKGVRLIDQSEVTTWQSQDSNPQPHD